MKKHYFVLSLLLGLLVVSCSHELPETPPSKVKDPAMIALYNKARQGDLNSLDRLCIYYMEGSHGFPKSYPKVIDCYEKMALLGDHGAQLIMGMTYCSDYQLKRAKRWPSSSEAERWLRMAYMSAKTQGQIEQVQKWRRSLRKKKAATSINSSRDKDIQKGIMNPGDVPDSVNIMRTGLLFL